jgi:hypothetical protein
MPAHRPEYSGRFSIYYIVDRKNQLRQAPKPYIHIANKNTSKKGKLVPEEEYL